MRSHGDLSEAFCWQRPVRNIKRKLERGGNNGMSDSRD